MDKIDITFQVCGFVFMFAGLIILMVLQFGLSRKEKRSFITFLSVLVYSKDKLSDKEKFFRKIGSFTFLIGFIVILMSGFDKFVDSFRHFNDPPSILRGPKDRPLERK